MILDRNSILDGIDNINNGGQGTMVKLRLFSMLFSILIVLLIIIYFALDPEISDMNQATREQLGGTYIRLSDGVTHYKYDGPQSGEIVVLVHGGTVPLWAWDEQIKALSAAGFRVLSYDKYGRGYSDRPNVVYDQELYQRQLLELVDKLGIVQRFDMIGVSLGGGTAINFTSQHPNRVQRLILISPLINNYKVPSVFQLPIFGEFLTRIIGIRVLISRFKSLYENNQRFHEYSRLYEEQTIYKGFQRSLLSMLRNDAIRNYENAYDIVGKQKRDILLIWGTDDKEITKDMIHEIRSFVPHINFIPVENSGHGILFQESEKVNDLILKFL